MTLPQNWDQVELQYRSLLQWSQENSRSEWCSFAVVMLEIVKCLRQEQAFENWHVWCSHGTLVAKPFPEKPPIFIYAGKSPLVRIYLYAGEVVAEETKVAQEQLIPAVYNYIERLKTL